MPTQTSELYNQWLHVIMHYTKYFCDKGRIYDEFYHYNSGINSFLSEKKLPVIPCYEYMAVWEGLACGFEGLINTAPNRRKASGAVLWRMVRAVHPDMANNELQNKVKKPETYRKERSFQKNMMLVLGNLKLDLSTKDKINALDYLEFKYSAAEYRRVYDKLGDFNFGENAEDFDAERMQTVKLFHQLLHNSKKSTCKDKIISARVFLETVARNGQILDKVRYTDIYGNVKMIDAAAKAEMLAAMKKSKIDFSDQCLAYFNGSAQPETDMNRYISIVLNKFRAADNHQQQKRVLAQPFAMINLNLQQEKNVSAKLVENYAKYICQYATYHFDNNSVRTDILENLLEREAEHSNERAKASSLFAEYISPRELKSIDKKLVLNVAQAYANSFVCSASEAEEFNPIFHERMTKMFSRIVTTHPYKKNEVQNLCTVLKSNGDKVMSGMGQAVMTAYTAARPQARKTRSR